MLTLIDGGASHVRPTWDMTWLAIAQTMAYRSRCEKRQVGAVIVTRDNRAAAVSYNGPPRGYPVSGTCGRWCPRMQLGETSIDYSRCATVHAEANALLRADFTDIAGGTIYVSSACCRDCAKLIANSGLRTVVHVVSPDDQHRDPDGVEEYLRNCGLSVQRATKVTDL